MAQQWSTLILSRGTFYASIRRGVEIERLYLAPLAPLGVFLKEKEKHIYTSTDWAWRQTKERVDFIPIYMYNVVNSAHFFPLYRFLFFLFTQR